MFNAGVNKLFAVQAPMKLT